MKRYTYGILFGVSGTIGAMALLLVAVLIVAPDHMPAPAVSRVVHLDEKFRFIREHPEIDPAVMAIGSSITWRQVSGDEIAPAAGGTHRFLNAAGVYLQMHQTRKLARFLVHEYPHVETLLILTSLPDFADCTTDKEPMFDRTGVALYAFERWPAAPFYLRYFAPRRYLNALRTMRDRRERFSGDLYIDKYGSGPVIVPPDVDLGLRYEAIDVDPFCVIKLAELSRDMTERGIRTMVVFTPIHPAYLSKYPNAAHTVTGIVDELQTRTDGHDTHIRLMHDDPRFGPDDFYDAFHLQWPAARRLSRVIAYALESLPTHAARPRFTTMTTPASAAPGAAPKTGELR